MVVVACLSAFTISDAINWKVKENSYSIKFNGKKVNGAFNGLKANIIFDEATPANSKISATIDASSANTGNETKDKHVGQGLEADKYPTIKFESISVSKKGAAFEAIGKLTIKDVTKEIVLPFTFENKGAEGVFLGKFSIVPKDYNVTKNGTPEVIEIELIVSVVK